MIDAHYNSSSAMVNKFLPNQPADGRHPITRAMGERNWNLETGTVALTLN